jgi:hypothetical protein
VAKTTVKKKKKKAPGKVSRALLPGTGLPSVHILSTDDRTAILNAIAAGLTMQNACFLVGFRPKLFDQWLTLGERLEAAIDAEAPKKEIKQYGGPLERQGLLSLLVLFRKAQARREKTLIRDLKASRTKDPKAILKILAMLQGDHWDPDRDIRTQKAREVRLNADKIDLQVQVLKKAAGAQHGAVVLPSEALARCPPHRRIVFEAILEEMGLALITEDMLGQKHTPTDANAVLQLAARTAKRIGTKGNSSNSSSPRVIDVPAEPASTSNDHDEDEDEDEEDEDAD